MFIEGCRDMAHACGCYIMFHIMSLGLLTARVRPVGRGGVRVRSVGRVGVRPVGRGGLGLGLWVRVS